VLACRTTPGEEIHNGAARELSRPERHLVQVVTEDLMGLRRHQLAYVGEFHALGVRRGAPEGPDESLRTEETVQFWEHDPPIQMAYLAT
jgi:hypothetical protein